MHTKTDTYYQNYQIYRLTWLLSTNIKGKYSQVLVLQCLVLSCLLGFICFKFSYLCKQSPGEDSVHSSCPQLTMPGILCKHTVTLSCCISQQYSSVEGSYLAYTTKMVREMTKYFTYLTINKRGDIFVHVYFISILIFELFENFKDA